MKNDKICFILPYFGKMPNFFNLWLKSCEYNRDIDWLIYTDDKEEYNYPDNVHVKYTTFEEMKNIIQSKFEFPITLDAPYKLCDYKPAYGDIFQDDIRNYQFWGHCDVDLIWGDIRKFVTDDLLIKHDKLFVHGHFVLYRNTTEINRWYKDLPAIKGFDYKTIYTNNFAYGFDEFGGKVSWGGIRQMIINEGKSQLETRVFDDIYPKYNNFYSIRSIPETQNLTKKKCIKLPAAYSFNKGTLKQHLLIEGKVVNSETMYVHFQKRPMEYQGNIDYGEHFTIIPNKFIAGDTI